MGEVVNGIFSWAEALVANAEHQPLHARKHLRAGTHGIGFLRHEERAAFQSSIAARAGNLREWLTSPCRSASESVLKSP